MDSGSAMPPPGEAGISRSGCQGLAVGLDVVVRLPLRSSGRAPETYVISGRRHVSNNVGWVEDFCLARTASVAEADFSSRIAGEGRHGSGWESNPPWLARRYPSTVLKTAETTGPQPPPSISNHTRFPPSGQGCALCTENCSLNSHATVLPRWPSAALGQ